MLKIGWFYYLDSLWVVILIVYLFELIRFIEASYCLIIFILLGWTFFNS